MTNDHSFNSIMNNYESTQEIVHRHIMAAAEKALAQLDETPDNESPSKKSLAERLASRGDRRGILSEKSIRRLQHEFINLPVMTILDHPGEEINIAVVMDLFSENERRQFDIDRVTIGEWMTEVEDFLDRQSDAAERLAYYKRFTEAFVRNLKKSGHLAVMNFLQINYSVFTGMMNMASDFKTQEFFDRILTTEYILDDGRILILGDIHENVLLRKLKNYCSDEKLTVGDFINMSFPSDTFRPFGFSIDYFRKRQSAWGLQYLGFWKPVFKGVTVHE